MMHQHAHTEAAALSTAAPALAPADLQALACALYGIEGGATALGGERDQNCLIDGGDGMRYVLKVSNPAEAPSVVDFQIAALEHVARVAPALPIPRVVRTVGGRTRERVCLDDGSVCIVRLLTYLDGVQIKETARTSGQRRAMGGLLARLNLALRDFTHPGAHHDLLWNVSGAHRLAAQLEDLVDPARQRLAQRFMTRFERDVLPRLPQLRAQVIHNDYHLYNVLVAPQEQERITGIIDFGDMLHAPLVGEVGTAAAFHMAGSEDPFAAAAQFLAAYHAVLPLTDAELEIVTDLMATRHLITALISEWRAARYPHNRAYIMRHNPAAWEALAMMADLSRQDARDRLLSEIRPRRTP
ncbi:MAG TPA: phosphotransferase [Herbaspirillum sp.]|uniref:phosphotransferase n=1 Tax=Herbaspirillum sp. TaxID=1890675 RepID=UPI002D41C115|nr:phosphotransferase [Herbaspirillum sp.]HZG20539.1 phosphotransferase [Herbaspirillum sp.]